MTALGALEPPAVSRTLGLLLVFPLLGLVVQACQNGRARARSAGLATLGLALGCTLGQAALLARAGAEGALVCHVATWLRVGSVVWDVNLRFDALSAGASVVTAAVALAAGAMSRGRGELAWIHLALFAGLLTFVSDDRTLLPLSWSVLACAGAGRAHRGGVEASARAAVYGAASLAALVVGIIASQVGADAGVPPGGALLAWLAAAGALPFALRGGGPPALDAAGWVIADLAGLSLLVRGSDAAPVPRLVAALFAGVGGTLFAEAVRRALGLRGRERWLAFVARAPAALTTLALGIGGARSAGPILIGSASVAALVGLGAARAGLGSLAPPPPSLPVFEVFARWGDLVASLERWVVTAAVEGTACTTRAASWALAWQDEHAVGLPGNAAARQLVGIVRRAEPHVGVPLVRLAWWALGVLAALALARGLWPVGT